MASLIGDGRDRPVLEARAKVLGLTGRVTWHGIVADAGRCVTAFDVFVLSSRKEGIPIVLFEAMSAQVPVVATRVGGVPDVLSEREAVLVQPEDPEALRAGIQETLDDPDGAAARTVAALERLRTAFGYESWLDRYEALYQCVAAGRRVTQNRLADSTVDGMM